MTIPNTKDIVWEKTRPDHYRSGKYALDRTRCQGRVAWIVWFEDQPIGSAPDVRAAKEKAYSHAWQRAEHATCTNPDCGCR